MSMQASVDSSSFRGILLAAGRGMRFDPAGGRNKLMQSIGDGERVVLAAARHLLAVLPTVLAVVRPGADDMAAQLSALGCNVTICPEADQGMGASLVHALSRARDANGWLIALGDMPYVRPSTVQALLDAIERGADIAVPVYQGRRGNPVAFSKMHLPELLRLRGDEGARRLLTTSPLVEVAVEDDGIHRDIDRPEDITSSTEQHPWNRIE